PDSCRDDGHGRRLHGRAVHAAVPGGAGGAAAGRRHRRVHRPRRRPHCPRAKPPRARAGELHPVPARPPVSWPARRGPGRRRRAASPEHSLVTFAVIAAIFHLFTHAFFKALLFLSAGSVMHAMGGVIDIRRFGGLRKVLPITHIAFLVGAVALAGIIPLAGFWSKDEILSVALGARQQSANYKTIYGVPFFSGRLPAVLTAFYTSRAYFVTFWGELKLPPEAGQHAHASHDTGHGHAHEHAPAAGHAPGPVDTSKLESPPVMTVPLMILAVFAFFIGAIVGPTELFAHFLEKTPRMPEAPEHAPNWALMVGSSVLAFLGIGLAWFLYVKRPELPGKIAASIPVLYQLSLNKFFVDEIYERMVARVQGFAEFCRTIDQEVVDGIVDLTGEVPRLVGSIFRPVQNGLLQFYALAMMLGLTV